MLAACILLLSFTTQSRLSFLSLHTLGLSFLLLSRPYEGCILLLSSYLLNWGEIKKRSLIIMISILLSILPACTYNYKVTGNIFSMPYTVYENTYGAVPTFYFQNLLPKKNYINPNSSDAYAEESFAFEFKTESLALFFSSAISRLQVILFFILPGIFGLLLIVLIRHGDRDSQKWLLQACFCIAAHLIASFFNKW